MLSNFIRIFFSFMQKFRTYKINTYLNSIEREKDPKLKLEKEVAMRIKGISMGGMAGGTAFLEFKENFYDKIPDEAGKQRVNNALVQILRSEKYKLITKAKAGYICADIRLEAATTDIESLITFAKKNSSEERLFKQSLEALKRGKSITDITFDKLRENGEL